MINYSVFRKEGYRSPKEVFDLEINNIATVTNETPLSMLAFNQLEIANEELEPGISYDKLIIQLPDVVTSRLIKDTINNNIDRGFFDIVDNGVIDFSNAKPILGDRFRIKDILKELPNYELIAPLVERYFYGNFMDNETTMLRENTSDFIWSLSDFVIKNELHNVKINSRFSFPVREQSMKTITEMGMNVSSKNLQERIIFDYIDNKGIAAELVHQYHTLDFPIYKHTEKLIDAIVSPYHKLGNIPEIS